MEISYRRTPPSLLERALARLAKRGGASALSLIRVDLVLATDLDIRSAGERRRLTRAV